ncbi:MAG: hypothetical protein ACFCVE_03010 [Phycisphaerae bacterium]
MVGGWSAAGRRRVVGGPAAGRRRVGGGVVDFGGVFLDLTAQSLDLRWLGGGRPVAWGRLFLDGG